VRNGRGAATRKAERLRRDDRLGEIIERCVAGNCLSGRAVEGDAVGSGVNVPPLFVQFPLTEIGPLNTKVVPDSIVTSTY